MRAFIAGFVFCILLGVVGAVGYSYSGMQDVAAATPENPVLDWYCTTRSCTRCSVPGRPSPRRRTSRPPRP